ncbi:MAG: alpha amylase C-terminal domain-containing protein, partial [Pseudomonadota bacterium]
NQLYRETPALHVYDTEPRGFEWVDTTDNEASVIAFLRLGNAGDAPALVVCNFTPVPRENYRVGVPTGGRWIERLNTDCKAYGGSGMGNLGAVTADKMRHHGHTYSLDLTLPPLSTVILTPET